MRSTESFDRAIEDIRDGDPHPWREQERRAARRDGGLCRRLSARRSGQTVSLYPGQGRADRRGRAALPGRRHTRCSSTLFTTCSRPIRDEWTSPPFAAEIVDGRAGRRRLIGRGAFNSKGPLVGFLAVVRAFQGRGRRTAGQHPLPHRRRGGDRQPVARAAHPRATSSASGAATARSFPISAPTPRARRRSASASRAWASSSSRSTAAPGAGRRDTTSMPCIRGWLASPGWELISALTTLQDPPRPADHRRSAGRLQDPTEEDRGLIAQAAQRSLRRRPSRRARRAPLQARRLVRDAAHPVPVRSDPQPRWHLGRHHAARASSRRRIWRTGRAPSSTCASCPAWRWSATLELIRKHLDRRGFGHVEMQVQAAPIRPRSAPCASRSSGADRRLPQALRQGDRVPDPRRRRAAATSSRT